MTIPSPQSLFLASLSVSISLTLILVLALITGSHSLTVIPISLLASMWWLSVSHHHQPLIVNLDLNLDLAFAHLAKYLLGEP